MSTASDIVKTHGNAIVCIQTTSQIIDWTRPFLSRTTQSSTGTGFIINLGGEYEDGSKIASEHVQSLYNTIFKPRTPRQIEWQARFVLTCAHCVENSNIGDIRVTFPRFGVSFFDAVVIKFCPDIDTALLVVFIPSSKVESLTCPTDTCSLKFGRSEALKPGEHVISVGFPLGGNIKTTQGSFSGFEGSQGIQHTSPISPGNSGGPLLNMNGQVVGINYQGVVSKGVSNVHYAQPSELIQQMLQDINKDSDVIHRRERVGICFQNTVGKGSGTGCDGAGVLVYHYEDVAVNSLRKHTGLHIEDEGVRNEFYAWFDKRIGPDARVPFQILAINWTPGTEEHRFYNIPAPESAVDIDCYNQVSASLQNNAYTSAPESTQSRIKIHLSQLLRRLPSESTIELHGRFIDHDTHPAPESVKAVLGNPEREDVLRLWCKKNYINRGPRAFQWYPYDGTADLSKHYLCLMGMCFMEMTRNHVVRFRRLQALDMTVSHKNMNNRRIIITYVFPNTDANSSRIMQAGDTVCKINDIDMMDELNNDPKKHGTNVIQRFKDIVETLLQSSSFIEIVNQENMRFRISKEQIIETHIANIGRGDYPQESTGPHALILEENK